MHLIYNQWQENNCHADDFKIAKSEALFTLYGITFRADTKSRYFMNFYPICDSPL